MSSKACPAGWLCRVIEPTVLEGASISPTEFVDHAGDTSIEATAAHFPILAQCGENAQIPCLAGEHVAGAEEGQPHSSPASSGLLAQPHFSPGPASSAKQPPQPLPRQQQLQMRYDAVESPTEVIDISDDTHLQAECDSDLVPIEHIGGLATPTSVTENRWQGRGDEERGG